MATQSHPDQPVPSSNVISSRSIPGLSTPAQPPSSATKRSRKKKAAPNKIDLPATPKTLPHHVAPIDNPQPAPVVASSVDNALEIPIGLPSNSPATVSPVQQVQKRIRAATKKLQRIAGYETSSVPLNEDQKRAIASKPALEATVKELQDLLKILEEDEKLDQLRIQAVREEAELKVQDRVDGAIAAQLKKQESDLTCLLQFLHLYSLVGPATRPTESFAPTKVSPVVQRATAQELAAVNVLFHRLADGPIAGGQGDARESINELCKGSQVDVIEGVTFGRVKEMLMQLTTLPAELPPPNHVQPAESVSDVPKTEEAPVQEQPAQEQPATAGGLGNMMFLQQSEVMPATIPPIKQTEETNMQPLPSQTSSAIEREPSVDHVARNKHLLETASIIGPDSSFTPPSEWNNNGGAAAKSGAETAPGNHEWPVIPEQLSATQAEVVARTIDWAEDVQDVENKHEVPVTTFAPLPPPPAGEHFPGQGPPPGPPPHHANGNGGRGNYRGRGGGYRSGPGGPRGGPQEYRGGRGWYRGGGGGGFRGPRSPMDMNGPGGWRPGPPEPNGGYRPRADYSGGRYGGHRGGQRGGGGYRPHPPPQVYHPEVAPVVANGNMY